MSDEILEDVTSEKESLRKSASHSLVTFVEAFPDQREWLVERLGKLYKELNEVG